MADSVLQQLASKLGIRLESVPEPSGPGNQDRLLLDLLAGFGIYLSAPAEAEPVLRQRELKEWQAMLDPVLVRREGEHPLTIPVRFPENTKVPHRWTLIEENGGRHGGEFIPDELPAESFFARDDERYACRLLSPGPELPCGYHEFILHGADEPPESRRPGMQLIITPEQCFTPPGLADGNRIWGLALHLHAVRSKHNWGIGDFSDLQEILNWAAEQGAGMINTAPLHDRTGSGPAMTGPYGPSCRSLLNTLFIDVEGIPELPECEDAVNRLQDPRFQARLSALRESGRIDHGSVSGIKNEILELLWRHFAANHLDPETERGHEFRQFQDRGGDRLRRYAIFVLLRNRFAAENSCPDWSDWPEPFRNPFSSAVEDFAAEREDEIGYYQYLQWLADSQLTAVGRRSLELGLKAGLLGQFPYGPDPAGFETWYYHDFFAPNAVLTSRPLEPPGCDAAAGLPLCTGESLQKFRYLPLIEGLRSGMRYTGAVFIRSLSSYFRAYFTCPGIAGAEASLELPFDDILGIIALESRRNRCMVIAEDMHLLPGGQRQLLQEMNIYNSLVFFREKDSDGSWLPAGDYPENGLISSSPPFLAALKGFWSGLDIAAYTDAGLFRGEKERERAILERASDRARLLITLEHAGLLPEGCGIDPAPIRELDDKLIASVLLYLAGTAAKIFLVSLNDLLGMERQAEPPCFPQREFDSMRYTGELQEIFGNREFRTLFSAFCRERGIGVTRPSAPAMERKSGKHIPLPSSFYRLQLHKNFTFQHAMRIIPYLRELGISHCYVSPFLTARPGSPHGYDIIDHSQINPEIGTRGEYEQFVAVLEQHGLAMILDVVPNHMGVGSDNRWWMDVLENGEASEYADFFDINWHPEQEDLLGRVLLPVLGEHYGKILENSELALHFAADSGSFVIHYYEHRFPVDPSTYPLVLNHAISRLEDRMGKQHNGYLEFQNLISSFDNLPGRREKDVDMLQRRRRHKEINRRILARLSRENPEIRQFIEQNVILFNGESGRPESFDLLHKLLEQQAYRLAFWRVAADEINYRRFFDINDLAGLRMEKMKVFRATHGLILDLVATGKLDGLRIDHPDGLYDPCRYFHRLQAAASGEQAENPHFATREEEGSANAPLYIVLEKILADFEHLPLAWPVHGTTGYDFLNMLNGLFVDSAAEKSMTGIYHAFIRTRINFDELVYRCKKLIIRSLMSGELNVLSSSLHRIAQENRYTRDFRLNRLRDALTEIVACFPVYRTYVTSTDIHKSDAQYIEWAVEKAKKKKQLDDVGVYDFIKNILLVRARNGDRSDGKILDFCMKFQQYTGPVMAKGLEDTSFYIYNRLVSLNEVGGEPKRFGTSVSAFHHTSQYRMRHWPAAMLSTSTHDTKRSEDARARINVLTEMPQEWQKRLSRWSRLNSPARTHLDNLLAPTRNDEYAYYQNLLGIWPRDAADELRADLIDRMKNYMLKACREAKEHTSWITPSEPYESAVFQFVEETLKLPDTAFLQDFLSFHEEVSWFGMLNSLSQVQLKLTAPGIPDIYQGNETWQFCLVDPDNRRPVDFDRRQEMLRGLATERGTGPEERMPFLNGLLVNLPDGRAKMFVVASILHLRREWKEVFEKGAYLPLEAIGGRQEHVCAFMRKHGGRMIISIAPRLYFKLMQGGRGVPAGSEVWGDTAVRLPEYLAGMELHNVYSGEKAAVSGSGGETVLNLAEALHVWPVGLLQGTMA
jgi:(1->4)-alpha-D-glucan 1-alpha-D-glucosylmutase